MKSLSLLLTSLVFSHLSFAQNVGIGTNTPHASAQFEVSSTTKGMLAPRMSTAQRNAIASPAKGLLVYDTDLSGLYHYDGSAWTAVGSGGGGFALPFEGTVNLALPGFKVTNAGMGPAIQAITTNEFGYALQASNTTNYGYSLYAYSRAPNGIGVYAFVDSSTGVKAASTNGIGVHAISTDSIAIRAAIVKAANTDPVILATHAGAGNALQALSNTTTAIAATTNSTSGGSSAVYGLNQGGPGAGVRGEATASLGVGVFGISTLGGIGVSGQSNYIAVSGNSNSGTALYGTSNAGFALWANGNLRLNGGNTSPASGAVLTSLDGLGNAVWKPAKVGFKVAGAANSVPYLQFTVVDWTSELYDLNNNFDIATNRFVVPVSGLYSFSAAFKMILNSSVYNLQFARIQIMLNRNGSISALADISGPIDIQPTNCTSHCTAHTDANLLAGDIVYVTVYQQAENSLNASASCGSCGEYQYFSGHLVVAD